MIKYNYHKIKEVLLMDSKFYMLVWSNVQGLTEAGILAQDTLQYKTRAEADRALKFYTDEVGVSGLRVCEVKEI